MFQIYRKTEEPRPGTEGSNSFSGSKAKKYIQVSYFSVFPLLYLTVENTKFTLKCCCDISSFISVQSLPRLPVHTQGIVAIILLCRPLLLLLLLLLLLQTCQRSCNKDESCDLHQSFFGLQTSCPSEACACSCADLKLSVKRVKEYNTCH